MRCTSEILGNRESARLKINIIQLVIDALSIQPRPNIKAEVHDTDTETIDNIDENIDTETQRSTIKDNNSRTIY